MAGKGTVLVIDDDPDFLEFVRIILESAGYVVYTAEDGEEGLSQAQLVRPDVVLVDVMMSYVLDGLNVVRALRMDPELSAPICLISAIVSADSEGVLPPGEKLDCDAFLSKPIEPEVLLRTVEQLLRKTGSLQEVGL